MVARRPLFIALLVLLIGIPAGPTAGGADDLPDLTVSPGTGSAGTVLTVTGFAFGEEPRSRRAALKADIGGKRTVVIELEIEEWKSDALRVKVPEIGQAQDLEYHVVFLDWTGRTLARARKPFTLDTGVPEPQE